MENYLTEEDDLFLYFCDNCKAEFELSIFTPLEVRCPECFQNEAFCIDDVYEDEYNIFAAIEAQVELIEKGLNI